MPYNYGNMGYSPNYGVYYGNAPMNGTGYSQGYDQQNYRQPQMNYQQMPQQPQISYQTPSQNQSIIWVQGEAGAKAYPVAAGQSVLLMDSEDAVLYVKSTDISGRPLPMESYDLVKRESVINTSQISQRTQENILQNNDMSEYVKISDLETRVNDMVNKAVSKALGE